MLINNVNTIQISSSSIVEEHQNVLNYHKYCLELFVEKYIRYDLQTYLKKY